MRTNDEDELVTRKSRLGVQEHHPDEQEELERDDPGVRDVGDRLHVTRVRIVHV